MRYLTAERLGDLTLAQFETLARDRYGVATAVTLTCTRDGSTCVLLDVPSGRALGEGNDPRLLAALAAAFRAADDRQHAARGVWQHGPHPALVALLREGADGGHGEFEAFLPDACRVGDSTWVPVLSGTSVVWERVQ